MVRLWHVCDQVVRRFYFKVVQGNLCIMTILVDKLMIVDHACNKILSSHFSVSIAMKFRHVRMETCTVLKEWALLTKFGPLIVFDSATISELEKGLKIGHVLDLPLKLACNSDELGELLATDSFVRPFNQLM